MLLLLIWLVGMYAAYRVITYTQVGKTWTLARTVGAVVLWPITLVVAASMIVLFAFYWKAWED